MAKSEFTVICRTRIANHDLNAYYQLPITNYQLPITHYPLPKPATVHNGILSIYRTQLTARIGSLAVPRTLYAGKLHRIQLNLDSTSPVFWQFATRSPDAIAKRMN
jgi:hypothetical protein